MEMEMRKNFKRVNQFDKKMKLNEFFKSKKIGEKILV